MPRIWRGLSRTPPDRYDLTKLIDRRSMEAPEPQQADRHIVCDIDKTYLETEFESVVRMARIAFEGASDKITVTGASAVLLAARWGDVDQPIPGRSKERFPRALHFVSSSPPQLRTVLEEKLMIDGLDWTSDTFKNQAYNIRMGRMDLLRHHVAYKSLAILTLIGAAAPQSRFYLIGDNAESDAFIYLGIKLLLERRLSWEGYQTYLEVAGVEPTVANDLVERMRGEVGEATVEGILIRNVPGYAFVSDPALTGSIRVFDNFYQTALILIAQGLITPDDLWTLTRQFHNHHGLTRQDVRGALRALGSATKGRALQKRVDEVLSRFPAEENAGETADAKEDEAKFSFSVDEGRLPNTEKDILDAARRWAENLGAEKERRN